MESAGRSLQAEGAAVQRLKGGKRSVHLGNSQRWSHGDAVSAERPGSDHGAGPGQAPLLGT